MALAFVTLLERLSLLLECKLVLPSLLPLHLWSKLGNWAEASVSTSEHHTALLVNCGQHAAKTLYLFWLRKGGVPLCFLWDRALTLDWIFFKPKESSNKKLSHFKSCWGDKWMPDFPYTFSVVYTCSDDQEWNNCLTCDLGLSMTYVINITSLFYIFWVDCVLLVCIIVLVYNIALFAL